MDPKQGTLPNTQKVTNFANMNVPVATITTTLNKLSKKATSPPQKTYLYEIVFGLGAGIAAHNSGFNTEEFIKDCGVSPEWATVAA